MMHLLESTATVPLEQNDEHLSLSD